MSKLKTVLLLSRRTDMESKIGRDYKKVAFFSISLAVNKLQKCLLELGPKKYPVFGLKVQ